MAIKIKKSRRGSFTRWAKRKGKTKGGRITGAAIEAGRKSKDPRIRKKAAFAENARTWARNRKG